MLKPPRELIRLRCGGDTIRQVAIEGSVTSKGMAVPKATLALYDFSAPAAEGIEKVLGTFHANAEGRFVICVNRRFTSDLLDLRAHAPGALADSVLVHFHQGINIQSVALSLKLSPDAKAP
jgi:hypothetical protein